jgi:hypothetical protein
MFDQPAIIFQSIPFVRLSILRLDSDPGLPDFSAHNIPKREKMYQIAAK